MIVHFRRKSHASRYCKGARGKMTELCAVEVPDETALPTDVPHLVEHKDRVELHIPMHSDLLTLSAGSKHHMLFVLSRLIT